jgi:hypothetical protein
MMENSGQIQPKLLTEMNLRSVENSVRDCARFTLSIPARHLRSFFEHGQWWVEDARSGAQWSVCDSEPGPFCFEQVTRGEVD